MIDLPSSEVRLRPATRADSLSVQALVYDVLRSYGLSPAPTTTDADLQDLEKSYEEAGGCFAVLEASEGGIIGTVGILPYAPGICELRKMYLHPAWRGRGLGRRLLEHALHQAAMLGFEEIILETASVLREAVALYRQFGFEPCPPVPGHPLAARCDVLMKRRVQAGQLG